MTAPTSDLYKDVQFEFCVTDEFYFYTVCFSKRQLSTKWCVTFDTSFQLSFYCSFGWYLTLDTLGEELLKDASDDDNLSYATKVEVISV